MKAKIQPFWGEYYGTVLGLQLSLFTPDQVLLLVGPTDLAPKDMDRIK